MPPLPDRDAAGRIHRDLVRAFRRRAYSDAWLVLVGNGAVALVTAALFVDDIPLPTLLAWLAAVMLAALARAAWRFTPRDAAAGDGTFLAWMRTAAACQGLAWGGGAALLMPWMSVPELAILVASLAGLTGSALNSLSADTPSFRSYAFGMAVPLTLGFGLQPADRLHLLLAAVTVVFLAAMLFVHRRVHHVLIRHLRLVDRLSQSEQAQAKLITELRQALSEVKQLTGLLPICANCKKVRDDFGYWNSVEHYISTHTDARLSHGLCPECFPKLFPGIPMPEPEEEHV